METKVKHLPSFQKEVFQLFRGQQVFYSTPLSEFDKGKQLLSNHPEKPSWIFCRVTLKQSYGSAVTVVMNASIAVSEEDWILARISKLRSARAASR